MPEHVSTVTGATVTSLAGEAHPRARLTEDIVRYARKCVADGWVSVPDLAEIFGVTYHTMYAAVTGMRWAHVPGAIALEDRAWWQYGCPRPAVFPCWCKECGVRFMAKTRHARFCSGACRARDFYWRYQITHGKRYKVRGL